MNRGIWTAAEIAIWAGLLVLGIAMMTSCSTLPPTTRGAGELDPSVLYRYDMKVCSGMTCGDGTLVVPLAPAIPLSVESKGDMDLFTVTSCHREEVRERQGKHADMVYKPREGIEDAPACLLHMGGYDKDRGRHAWGLVDFITPMDTLVGELICNGNPPRTGPVHLCMSKAGSGGEKGLIQMIRFAEDVRVEPLKDCPLPVTRGREFKFNINRGHCLYIFEANIPPWRRARLTTIGYEAFPVRKE